MGQRFGKKGGAFAREAEDPPGMDEGARLGVVGCRLAGRRAARFAREALGHAVED